MILRFSLPLALVFAISGCFDGGGNNPPLAVHGTIEVKTIDGRLYVVLATNQLGADESKGEKYGRRDYLIKGPLAEELRSNFRGKSVTVEGTVCSSSLSQIADCLRPAKIMID